MRIACPSCDAAYDVPPERVPPGRGVKCVRCGGVWAPVALVDAEPAILPLEPPEPAQVPDAAVPAAMGPAIEPAAIVAPDPVPGSSADPTPDRAPDRAPDVAPDVTPGLVSEPARSIPTPRRGGAWLGWLLTVVILVGLGWAATTQRASINRAWPPSERVYQLFGKG